MDKLKRVGDIFGVTMSGDVYYWSEGEWVAAKVYNITTRTKKDGTKRTYKQAVAKYHGREYRKYVHRLIATALIPNPMNLPQVNHKNGNSLDNRVENLEWVTASQNRQHAYDIGLAPTKKNNGKLCEACKDHLVLRTSVCAYCKKKLATEGRKQMKRRHDVEVIYNNHDVAPLSFREKNILHQYYWGSTYQEIGDTMKRSKQAIHDTIKRLKRYNGA